MSFTSNRVSSLRTNWEIPCFKPSEVQQDGKCVSVDRAVRGGIYFDLDHSGSPTGLGVENLELQADDANAITQ